MGSLSGSEPDSQALSRTSVERQPELVVNEKSEILCSDRTGQGVIAPQATTGWKLEVSPNSYTAAAVQEALDADIAKYPSLDTATQRDITLKFRALHQRVHDEGYYECRFSEYAKEMVRYVALFGVFVSCLYCECYTASAVSLGLFWQQIMFTAHDAGHGGITHNYVLDSLIGIFIGNFCCGLSIGWWKSSHNVHHFVTNDPVSTYPALPSLLARSTNFTIGTRSRHAERSSVLHLPSFFQLRQVQLLQWVPVRLELSCRLHRQVPEMDILSDHGCSPFQFVLPILVAFGVG